MRCTRPSCAPVVLSSHLPCITFCRALSGRQDIVRSPTKGPNLPTRSMLISRGLATIVLMTLASVTSLAAQEFDWSAASREPLAHLQTMIRLNTVNPPGNELPVARHLEEALKTEGIETHLFE